MGRTGAKYLFAGVVFVGVVALATSFSPSVVEAVNPDEELLRIFPADSDGILFLDFAVLRDIEYVNRFVRDWAGDLILDPVEEFTAETGVDPVNDIQQIIAGRSGPDEFLIVVQVGYDAYRVESYFAVRDVRSEIHSGRTIYAPGLEDDNLSVVFLDGQVLVGSTGQVRESLDRSPGGPSVLDNTGLMASIEAIEEGSQVWGVGSFNDMVPELLAPPMATDLIAALENVTYQMRFDSGVTARLAGQFTTVETARRAGDLVRGFVALGKMGTASQPDMLELLDGLQVDSVENAVEINFAASQELLDRIAESGAISLPTN